jgi:hypothetical protein
MRLVVFTVFLAGCTFGVNGLQVGGEDASVDAAVPDGSESGDGGPADLHGTPPDGVEPGGVGWPCGTPFECANGLCVDGYCCEEACDPNDPTNLCKSCNVPGFEGHCVAAFDGTDPRQQCATDAPSTCGKDGQCDGTGKCRLYNAGTACQMQSCANGIENYAAACDGIGHCVTPGPASSCYPYDCANGQACATTCTTSAQCATGVPCTGGICGKRSDGQPCATGSDCQSGTCAQGVCCATSCNNTCFACNLPGSEGTCAPVPAGLDPLNQCAAQPRSTCAQDGTCDGSGQCRLWKSGTTCSGASCMGDNRVTPGTCDGFGTCNPGMTKACGVYTCNSAIGACFGSPCKSNAQCAQGKTCNLSNGKCH